MRPRAHLVAAAQPSFPSECASGRSYGCSCQSGLRTSPRLPPPDFGPHLRSLVLANVTSVPSSSIHHADYGLAGDYLVLPCLSRLSMETRFSVGSQGSHPKNACSGLCHHQTTTLTSRHCLHSATSTRHCTVADTSVVYSPGYTTYTVAPPRALAGGPDMCSSRVLKSINHSLGVTLCTRPALRRPADTGV